MFFSRYLSINEKFTYTCSWQEANSRPSDGVSTAAHKTQTNNARPDKTDQSRRGFKVAVTCVVVCSICFPQTHRSHHHVLPLWVLLSLADKSRLLWGGISDTFHALLVFGNFPSHARSQKRELFSLLYFEVDANFAFFLLFLTSKPRQRSGASRETREYRRWKFSNEFLLIETHVDRESCCVFNNW